MSRGLKPDREPPISVGASIAPEVAERAGCAGNLSRFLTEDDGFFQGLHEPTEIHFHQDARVRHPLGERKSFDGPMVPAARVGQACGSIAETQGRFAHKHAGLERYARDSGDTGKNTSGEPDIRS